MGHIAFNYHDPVVQLRLAALLACSAMLICLAALEFRRRLPRYAVIVLSIAFVLAAGMVGYVLVRLQNGAL